MPGKLLKAFLFYLVGKVEVLASFRSQRFLPLDAITILIRGKRFIFRENQEVLFMALLQLHDTTIWVKYS